MKKTRKILSKILSLILIATLAQSLIPSKALAFSDTSTLKNEREIEVVSKLGIMAGYEDGTFKPEDYVTRGEFATVIANMFRLIQNEDGGDNWYKNFYMNSKDEEELKTTTDSDAKSPSKFIDVPENNWAFKAINAVSSYGLMNGINENEFLPDRQIYFQEAVKTLVNALGFGVKAEISGGYPRGYVNQATNIGISKGYNGKTDAFLTRANVAKLVYNSLDIEFLELDSVGDNVSYNPTGETILSKILSVRKVTGTMKENTVTTFYSPKEFSKEIIIGNTVIKVTEEDSYADGYLGHIVTAYSKYDKDSGSSQLIYAYINENDESTAIEGRTVKGLSENKIFYETNDKLQSIEILAGTPIIYNGIAVKTLEKSYFDMQDGNVTIIKNNSKCDIVIVKKYSTFYVAGIDAQSFTVYNKLHNGTDSSIVLDENISDVNILTADGQKLGFSDLAVGDSLAVANNGNFYEIIVSKTKKQGVVDEILEVKGDNKLIISKESYLFSEDFLNAETGINIEAGDNVTIYLDSFSKISYAVISEKSGYKKGIFLGAIYKDGNDFNNLIARIYSSVGKLEVLEMAQKVIYDDEKGIISTLSGEMLKNKLSQLSGLIVYSLNNDGLVNYIQLPLDKIPDADGRLYKIYEAIPSTDSIIVNGIKLPGVDRWNSIYRNYTLTDKVVLSNSTLIFSVPNNNNPEEFRLAGIKDIPEVNNPQINFIAYGTNKSIGIADVLLLKDVKISENTVNPRSAYSVVTSLSEGCTTDGFSARKAVLNTSGVNSEVFGDYDYYDEKGESCSAFEVAKSPNPDDKMTYKIKKGDIIRYSLDEVSGYVNNVILVYSSSIPNPSGGKNGYLAGGFTSKYYLPSMYVDVANDKTYYLHLSGGSKVDGNPYALNIPSPHEPIKGAHRFDLENVVYFGCVYAKKDNYLSTTTQNLSVSEYIPSGIPKDVLTDNTKGYLEEGYYGIYINRNTIVNGNSKIMVITLRDEDYVSVKNGSLMDIKSYSDCGVECSKVLIKGLAGNANQIFVINDYRTK